MSRMLPLGVGAAVAAVGLSGLSGVSLGSTGGHAAALPPVDGVPQATCFWFGPMGIDDPVTNLAYPEENVLYWGARFRMPAGSTMRFEGRYPHARYMSLNSYGVVEGVEHAAVDALEDTAIRPDRGSVNPYDIGADRYAPRRSYTVRMTEGQASRARNVLDAPTTNAGAVQELIYRVYLPDAPRDRRPRSLPRPVLRLADGTELRGSGLCDAINDPQRYFSFRTMPPAVYTGLVNTPGADPATNPSYSPVRWERFFNQPLALSVYRLLTPSADRRLADLALGDIGGYYDNRNVRYSVGPINAAYGKVLVLRGKLPRTPRTGPEVRRMQGGQMRYWSICENGSPVETDGIDCVSDADLRPLLEKDRRYTVVVSRRIDRPDNALRRCGVAWLNWGDRDDITGRQTGTLLLRNLDADPSFPRSLQKVGVDDVDVLSRFNTPEKKILGPYQPVGRYTSTSGFEDRGCPGAQAPGRG